MKNFKNYVDDFKNLQFKKGIGIESQKIYANKFKIKKYRNKIKLNGYYRTKVNSKAFAISILTASTFIIYSSQNRDSKCFRINFCSITAIEFHLVSITCLHRFFDF